MAYCPNSHREKLDDVQLPAVKILIEDLINEEFLNEHFDHVVELNKVLLKEHEKRESVIDRKIKDVKENIKSLTDITENPRHKDRNVDELLDRLDERRTELKQLEKDKKNLATESDGLMAFVNDRDRIIKNALDMRTIIETAEPQIANQFIKLFVEKLVIKDHIGTIHFKVPSLGEGPYRPPESFKIGEYPGPIPDPFESEKYPFERRTGISRVKRYVAQRSFHIEQKKRTTPARKKQTAKPPRPKRHNNPTPTPKPRVRHEAATETQREEKPSAILQEQVNPTTQTKATLTRKVKKTPTK